MNLAVGAQRLIARIRVDIAVDSDRHVVQLVGDEREAIAQRCEEIGIRAASIWIVSTPPVACSGRSGDEPLR